MEAKVASAICLNLSDEVIHDVIDEKKAGIIWQKLQPIDGEEFDA
jgi:hypothetical protein